MKKNDIITLNITDISVDGFGIGRYDNIAVFVPFAAVGDTLQVLIVKVLKNYCFGKTPIANACFGLKNMIFLKQKVLI